MPHDVHSVCELEAQVPEVDWIGTMAALDECDAYVVLVADPQTGEIDSHGPYDGPGALTAADEARRSCDAEGLTDVVVRVSRLHLPVA